MNPYHYDPYVGQVLEGLNIGDNPYVREMCVPTIRIYEQRGDTVERCIQGLQSYVAKKIQVQK